MISIPTRKTTRNAPVRFSPLLLAALLFVAFPISVHAGRTDAIGEVPAWQPPALKDVRTRTFAWLKDQGADESITKRAHEIWADTPDVLAGIELLERTAMTFALLDDKAQSLVKLCSQARQAVVPPDQSWLLDPETPSWKTANLRLLYGRWLAHERLFDEAREQLEGLEATDVVDPATLLFYQGVVYHRLLEQKAGIGAVRQLLDVAEASPRRYVAVARLMEADLEKLKEDSLDHIARRMDDVERRLDLGRAGPRVRSIEDGIVESLDKMIEKMEEQQQQQCSSSSDQLQPNKPADSSRLMGGRGPGEVTKRNVGNKNGWGDLPPKKREEALQQIGREFPSHYRDVIEQYFRKLASEEDVP